MTSPARAMLEATYDRFADNFPDSPESWDKFIEFLACDHCMPVVSQIGHRFEWLYDNSQLIRALESTYRPAILRNEFYDHLGEMYLEKLVSTKEAKAKGLFLTPMEVAFAMAKMTIPETEKPVNVLDPAVGTGRLLLAAYQQAPKARLFGVDTDLRALRIAFTNLAIHGITGYLLHANSLYREIDLSTEEGRHNWQYCNHWNSCIDKLKPIKGKGNGHSDSSAKHPDLFEA